MAQSPAYEVVVVGGGPAGLTAAVYTTRLGHDTALINDIGGRSMLVDSIHNLIGVSEDVSGYQLFENARAQLTEYGTAYYEDRVSAIHDAETEEYNFRVQASETETLAKRLVLATGFDDNPPQVPGLLQYSGRGLHYCIHCDGYLLVDQPAYVLGHGESAAHVAMILLNFTDDTDLLLDGKDPEWNDEMEKKVRAHPLEIIDEEVVGSYPERDSDDDEAWLGGLTFADGTTRDYAGGFAMYGLQYNNDLAKQLGCDLTDAGAVAVNEMGRTSVDGVYAVGDLTPGHDQTPIVMGEGAKAGIALHQDFRTFPMSLDEIEAAGPPDDIDVPAMSDELRESAHTVNCAQSHSGMLPPAHRRQDD